jgi:hypothetical protein
LETRAGCIFLDGVLLEQWPLERRIGLPSNRAIHRPSLTLAANSSINAIARSRQIAAPSPAVERGQ